MPYVVDLHKICIFICILEYSCSCCSTCNYRSWYEFKWPRKRLRIPNTDPVPFVFCEFCKNMQTLGNAPHNPLITSLSKFRGPPEWCEVRHLGCCIKSVKKSIFHEWAALTDIKSYSIQLHVCTKFSSGCCSVRAWSMNPYMYCGLD